MRWESSHPEETEATTLGGAGEGAPTRLQQLLCRDCNSKDPPADFEIPPYAAPPSIGPPDWEHHQPTSKARRDELLELTEVFLTKVIDDAPAPEGVSTRLCFSDKVGWYKLYTHNPIDAVQCGPLLRIIAILETEAKGKHSRKYTEGRLVFYFNKKWYIFPDESVNTVMHQAAVNIGATRMELNVGGARGSGERIGGPIQFAFFDRTQGSASERRTTESPPLYQLHGWLGYRPIVAIVIVESGCTLSHPIQDNLMLLFREKLGGDVLLISLGGHGSIQAKAFAHAVASTLNEPVFIIEGRLIFYYNKQWHIFPDESVNRAMHEAAVNIGVTCVELNVGSARGAGECAGGPIHVAFFDGTRGSASGERTAELPYYRPIVAIIIIELARTLSYLIQDKAIILFQERLGGDVLPFSEYPSEDDYVYRRIDSPRQAGYIIPDGDGYGAGIATEIQHAGLISQYQNHVLAIGRAKTIYVPSETLDQELLLEEVIVCELQ